MLATEHNPFSDLEELDELNGRARREHPEQEERREQTGGHVTSKGTVKRFKCRGCNGRGVIHVYRRGGGWGQIPEIKKCWKGCNGTGYTATDPDRLEEQRKRREEKKCAEAGAKARAAKEFLDSRPDVRAWFERQADRGNQFGMDLQDKLFKYGSLTPKQLACIERDIEKYEEAKKERRAAEPQTGLDLSWLPTGMYAVPGGDTRLKLRVRHATKGRWKGWIFVDDGAEYGSRQNYGRQAPGGCYQGKIVDELNAILKNPKAAMAAYGHLVGRCGRCGRPLEDEESVARGIGPVCASKVGW